MANNAGAGGRPPGQRTATEKQRLLWEALVDDQGYSPGNAAMELGFAYETGKNWERRRKKDHRSRPSEKPMLFQLGQQPPKGMDDLSDEAYHCVQETPESFDLFRTTYLERRLEPWQQQAGKDLLAAELAGRDSEDRVPFYLLANVFPGAGKSATFTHDWPLWRLVCARVRGEERRIQLGARTITQSQTYVMRIINSFEQNHRLLDAFGRFKPLNPRMWTKTAFFIEHLPDVRHDEKEPTVFAVSQESGFLGFRAHMCIWDDLVDNDNSRTVESRDRLNHWWWTEAESRVEPAGLVALVGTRQGPADLFRVLGDEKVTEVDEADDPMGLEDRPIYQWISYPAHDEAKCDNPGTIAREGHISCLTAPHRLSWKRILRLRKRPMFELTYQQRDVDNDLALVQKVWLEGGRDKHGQDFLGCYDYDRGLWESPPPFALDHGDYRAAITVDPSPTQFWAVQLWVHDRRNDVDYLIGQERKRMSAIDLLDLQPGTVNYTGLLEEMVTRARELKINIRHLIVEDNAAQRFMLQYSFFRDWARRRGIIIMPHTTTGVKLADAKYGIGTLATRYFHGQIRLPMKTIISKDRVGPLIQELLAYPQGDTDDCVMSNWFFHFARDRLGASKDRPRYFTDDGELPPALAAARHGEGVF